MRTHWTSLYAFVCVGLVGCSDAADSQDLNGVGTTSQADQLPQAETFSTAPIDPANPFFLELGTNGRTCGTCHSAKSAWTITPAAARAAFDATDGLDPLFRPVDATTRPDADVSTKEARKTAYKMLLNKGLIRFTRSVAATAEFEVTAVDDPYGWSTPASFSNFRRIPSTANPAHESSVTWTGLPPVRDRLLALMNGATAFHAQTTVPVPPEQQVLGADMMLSISFAQIFDPKAGGLNWGGARGGAENLSNEPFYPGINGLLGDSQTGAPFNPEVFTLYGAWLNPFGPDTNDGKWRARTAIARGERLFNTMPFTISNVPGLNDALGQTEIVGTCSTCHNTPNVGGHSEFRLMNTGIADASRRSPDVPLLTVRNKTTGEEMQTTDLGRGQGSGKWADLGKVRVPPLRGVGSRAPYFHDGSARDLDAVLNFYQGRFGLDLNSGSREDLRAFLKAL